MNYLMYLSIIPVVILSFLIARFINVRFNYDIEEARQEVSNKTLKRLRKSYHDKVLSRYGDNKRFQSIFHFYDDWLVRSGNPYKLNALSYLFIKALIIVFFVVYILFTGQISLPIVAAFLFIYFFINISTIRSNADDEAQIKRDLPSIYNILEIETYAGIPIDQALLDVYEEIKCKRLKKAFMELSSEIITKRNIPEALNHLREKFYSQDILSFCLTIEQGVETGKTRNMLSNQRQLLYRTYLNSKDIETTKNEFKVGIALTLLFISMGAITVYSYIDYISSSINFIIK